MAEVDDVEQRDRAGGFTDGTVILRMHLLRGDTEYSIMAAASELELLHAPYAMSVQGQNALQRLLREAGIDWLELL